MSSIEKLSIRGIRSFYPGRDECIEFNQPLTVILGANGCGKTTIIECLKVSCTGSLPPSARSGQSFIHDPKLRGDVEVKASVRLRFKSRAGQMMVVQRTFRLQQMKASCKFQAMDGVVRMINDHGEKVSINQKCSELDKHIPDLLGVSKAVLESVIFCHQEESNWPLQEGAVLKKRFDDIFESARYTKALEAIKKLKKERLAMAKDMKRDLDVLGEQVKRVRDMEEQLETREAKLLALKADYETMSGEIGQLAARVTETDAELAHVRDVAAHVRELERTAAAKSDEMARAFRSLGPEMTESTASLEEILANYDSILTIKHKEVLEIEAQEAALTAAVQAADDRTRQLTHDKGALDATLQQHAAAVRARADLAAELGSAHGIAASLVTADDARIFANRLADVVAALEAAVAKLEAEARASDDSWSGKQTALSAQVHHCSETLGAKSRELQRLKRQEEALLTELQKGGDASQREGSLADARLADAEAKLAAQREADGSAALKAELLALEKDANALALDVRALEDQLAVLRSFERDQITLEHKRAEHAAKRAALDAALAASPRVLPAAPTLATLGEDRGRVEALALELARATDAAVRAQQALQRQVAEAQAKKRHDEQALAQTRSSLDELSRGPLVEWKALLAERGLQADTALAALEAAYLAAKDKTQSRKNAIAFLRTYKTKGEKEHCCPLCQRGLSSEEEAVFSQLIADKMDDAKNADKILKAERLEQAALDAWKRCEALLPAHREATRLESALPAQTTALDALYQSLRELDVQLQAATATATTTAAQREEATAALKALTALAAQSDELAFAARRLADDEEHLAAEKSLRLGAASPTLTGAQAARDAKQAALHDGQARRERLQRELQAQQEATQALQNDVHKWREEQAQLRQRRADAEKARDAREQLRATTKALQEEVATLQRDLPGLQRELQQCKNEQLLARDNTQRALVAARDRLVRGQADRRRFEDKSRQVDALDGPRLEARARELARETQAQLTARENASRQLAGLQPAKATARRALDENAQLKRQIDDNLNYRRLQAAREQAEAAVAAAQRQLAALPGIADVERAGAEAKARLAAAKEGRAMFAGKQVQLEEMVREVQVQLRSRELKNVDEKQRHKLIDYETTMMAVSDLDKYYKALDVSLMEFHSKKIEEINAIIRTLWQITYRGQDIDTIEILSGQDEGAKSGRSYNYRVVMRKENTLLDMRGRCSAGQKVLAGLVIRLALAETFCLNCGILALDEPTTNLDSANKLGLAQAIADILKAREAQHNFQLICITHDEEFVQMLNRSQLMGGTRPEFFWTVSREEMAPRYYCSKIEKRSWSSDFVYHPADDI
ncbi:DNA repair protein RAD50 [Achlya hypogyna]|uniref:DNA repair protein RAD50 n=1 Tax=Achlya hypogyna TaxID=1202772 RepID=A0A1V9ZB00_ACHHY|nr:DNA repair protein RAD50 [Achlya hypogyna]